jgi:hypothetical protein
VNNAAASTLAGNDSPPVEQLQETNLYKVNNEEIFHEDDEEVER